MFVIIKLFLSFCSISLLFPQDFNKCLSKVYLVFVLLKMSGDGDWGAISREGAFAILLLLLTQVLSPLGAQ